MPKDRSNLAKTTALALTMAAVAGVVALPAAVAHAGPGTVQLAACNPCNPCAVANPCNPCAAANPCNPCAANPCAAANPCNPCAANPCNPCAAKTSN